MRYTIVTEEGKYLPFKKGGETQRSEDEENRALVGGVGDGDSVRDFLLRRKEYAMVRMANQSIFVDMLEASAAVVTLFSLCGAVGPAQCH